MASHPDLEYYGDVVIHTPRGDIEQEECCLAPTIRNLLGTLASDHEGKNGANDDALLVGECGEPGCCGVDFGVRIRDGTVELSWADPAELRAAENRFSRGHPNQAIFPNELQVGRITAQVPVGDYVGDVLRLAADFLRARGRRGSADAETQRLFESCGRRYPEILRAISSKAGRSDILRFDTNGSK